jgi:hypothetical protein
MTATQLTTIRVKAANQAHETMAAYTGKDKKDLAESRHNAAVKAWATRNANKAAKTPKVAEVKAPKATKAAKAAKASKRKAA